MNFHASALILGDRGLIIAGPSGSGKTALCQALLNQCSISGLFSRFVADDQVFLSKAGNRLIAKAPPTIAGKVEVRGYQPSRLGHEPTIIVDAMIRLLPAGEGPRYADEQVESVAGQPIPVLALAAQNTPANVHAVLAWFNLPPFEAMQGPDSPQ